MTLLAPGRFGATGLPYAAGAGVLSSLPYAGDLIALRRVPARFLGMVMSVHPCRLVLLGQAPRSR